MKITKSILTIVFVIIISNLCFAQTGQDFIRENTIFACYGNIEHLYNYLKQAIVDGYENKDSKMLSLLSTIKTQFFSNYLLTKSKISDEELVRMIKNWDDEGFIVPSGSFKMSVSDDKSFYINIDAKIDTDFIMEKIYSTLPADSMKVQEKSNGDKLIELLPLGIKLDKRSKGIINVNIPNSFDFDITPNGMCINTLTAEKGNINKSWNSLIKNMSDSNCFLNMEMDTKSVFNLFKDTQYVNSPFYGGIFKLFSNSQRIRLLGKKNNYMLIAAINDEKERKEYLEKYKDLINQKYNFISIYLKTIIGEIETIDKNPWIGFQTNNNSEYVSSMNLLPFAIIAKSFVEKTLEVVFANSPTIQTKICQNNSKKITAAIYLYNIKNSEKITSMKPGDEAKQVLKKLLRAGYIKSEPKCYKTKKFSYYSEGDPSEYGVIRCEEHESPYANYNEEDLMNLKSKFDKDYGRYEELKCQYEQKILKNKIEYYNKHNEGDKITFIEKGNAEAVLKKLYKKGKYPVCPTTNKPTFFTEGDLTEGYSIECETHKVSYNEE